MGVKGLWQIITGKVCNSFEGKTLAVDLSGWICRDTRALSHIYKPHLRNLLYRVRCSLNAGARLIFIVEGNSPEFKATAKNNLKPMLMECSVLLRSLGIPVIQSSGESEATCAYLNANGIADGCITNDSDSFLYGAKIVYRNFKIKNRIPVATMYKASEIGLDRRQLVSLALLLGCDYIPKGVPGVGKKAALKLLKGLPFGVDVLQRFEDWKPTSMYSDIEEPIKRKALAVPGFPDQRIIREYLEFKEVSLPAIVWVRPNLDQFLNAVEGIWTLNGCLDIYYSLFFLFEEKGR